MALHAGSRNARLLELLAEGPATTGELVAETGWPRRNVCARLIIQMKAGRITREPYERAGERSRFLWKLAQQGRDS